MIRGAVSPKASSIRTIRPCAVSDKSLTSSNKSDPPLARANAVDGPSIPSKSTPDTTTKGNDLRSEKSWIARAINDFPVPLSPVISTGNAVFITRATKRYRPCIAGVRPTNGKSLFSWAAFGSRGCGARRLTSKARAARFIRSGKSNGLGR